MVELEHTKKAKRLAKEHDFSDSERWALQSAIEPERFRILTNPNFTISEMAKRLELSEATVEVYRSALINAELCKPKERRTQEYKKRIRKRFKKELEEIREKEVISCYDLAEILPVCPTTVWRDLKSLEEDGIIKKVRKGAGRIKPKYILKKEDEIGKLTNIIEEDKKKRESYEKEYMEKIKDMKESLDEFRKKEKEFSYKINEKDKKIEELAKKCEFLNKEKLDIKSELTQRLKDTSSKLKKEKGHVERLVRRRDALDGLLERKRGELNENKKKLQEAYEELEDLKAQTIPKIGEEEEKFIKENLSKRQMQVYRSMIGFKKQYSPSQLSSHMEKEYGNVPYGTIINTLNVLLDRGWVIKKSRGVYSSVPISKIMLEHRRNEYKKVVNELSAVNEELELEREKAKSAPEKLENIRKRTKIKMSYEDLVEEVADLRKREKYLKERLNILDKMVPEEDQNYLQALRETIEIEENKKNKLEDEIKNKDRIIKKLRRRLGHKQKNQTNTEKKKKKEKNRNLDVEDRDAKTGVKRNLDTEPVIEHKKSPSKTEVTEDSESAIVELPPLVDTKYMSWESYQSPLNETFIRLYDHIRNDVLKHDYFNRIANNLQRVVRNIIDIYGELDENCLTSLENLTEETTNRLYESTYSEQDLKDIDDFYFSELKNILDENDIPIDN